MSVTTEAPRRPACAHLHSAHEFCVVCGARNGHGLNLSFDSDGDGWIQAMLDGRDYLQGYSKMMHGGIISLLLDAAMTHCLFAHGCTGVTARMEVKFRHPVAVDSPVQVRARLIRSSPPGHQLKAELLQNGKLMATAVGLFVHRPELTEKVMTDAEFEHTNNRPRREHGQSTGPAG